MLLRIAFATATGEAPASLDAAGNPLFARYLWNYVRAELLRCGLVRRSIRAFASAPLADERQRSSASRCRRCRSKASRRCVAVRRVRWRSGSFLFDARRSILERTRAAVPDRRAVRGLDRADQLDEQKVDAARARRAQRDAQVQQSERVSGLGVG